jgi:hypothetical protein
VIRLRPKPANDTVPLGGCDCCHGTDHDSSAHRDPVAAMEVAFRHEERADELVLAKTRSGDPERARLRGIAHHRTMAEMWKRTAATLAEKARRKAEGT